MTRVRDKVANTPRPAPHVPTWSSVFFRTNCLLQIPVVGSIRVGGALLLLVYFGVLLFAALYKNNIFKNSVRAGLVAASQIPVVVIFAMKNNFISALLGVGYVKVHSFLLSYIYLRLKQLLLQINYIHRFAGRLLVLAANVHAIGFSECHMRILPVRLLASDEWTVYKWTLQGVFTLRLEQPRFRFGVVALVAVDILFVFSLAICRQRAYNIFLISHLVAFVVFIVAVRITAYSTAFYHLILLFCPQVCLHMPASIPYAIAGVGLYGLDRILRIFKTHYSTALIHCIPTLNMTYLQISHLNAGWRAGQHVRIRVISRGMGWFGWTEVHPLSIATASDSPRGEGIVLMCHKAGGWSHKLYDLAQEDDEKVAGPRSVKVAIEGPYGNFITIT